MIQIRHSMFETNSSSTHVLVIMKTSDFKKFCRSEESFDGDFSELVFWNRYASGKTSDSQKFKTGGEFIQDMISDGIIHSPNEVTLKSLKEYANPLSYYTYDQIICDMDDWDDIAEGDITAFSYSGYC